MKPFPDSWTGQTDAEAGYPPRQRTWPASLARSALIILSITGALAFAAKAIPSCAALMPGAHALTIPVDTATHQSAPVAEAEEKVFWVWVGKQAEHFGGPIKRYGFKGTDCQNFDAGVSFERLTWISSEGTGKFEGPTFQLQTFVNRKCAPGKGDKTYSEDAIDVPAKFFSWKVVPIIKDD